MYDCSHVSAECTGNMPKLVGMSAQTFISRCARRLCDQRSRIDKEEWRYYMNAMKGYSSSPSAERPSCLELLTAVL